MCKLLCSSSSPKFCKIKIVKEENKSGCTIIYNIKVKYCNTFFVFVVLFYQADIILSEQDDKTPGRLQTVWPPLKAEEEKIGLKYTEAGN